MQAMALAHGQTHAISLCFSAFNNTETYRLVYVFQVNRNVFVVVVVAEFSLRRSHLRLCFTSRSGCLQDITASADLSVVFVHYHYGGKEAKRQRACKCVMAGIPYHLFTVSAGKRID